MSNLKATLVVSDGTSSSEIPITGFPGLIGDPLVSLFKKYDSKDDLDISDDLNAEMLALNEKGGGIVTAPVPECHYSIDKGVVVPSGVCLRGSGLRQQRQLGLHSWVSTADVGIKTAGGADYTFIEKIRVDVNKTGGVGIMHEDAKRSSVRDCLILMFQDDCTGFLSDARRSFTGDTGGSFYCDYYSISSISPSPSPSNIGFNFIGAAGGNNGRVNRNNGHDLDTANCNVGYQISDSNANVFNGCSAENATSISVRILGVAFGNMFPDFYAEGFGVTDVEFGPDTEYNEVHFTNSNVGGLGGTRRTLADQGGNRNVYDDNGSEFISGPKVYRKFPTQPGTDDFIRFQDETGAVVARIDASGNLV